MAWDFSTDPEFAAQLEWMRTFVDEEIEPLSLFYDDMTDDAWARATAPLKQQVKDRGLWACHLDPDLGGQGYGQVKLALMHEILGRCRVAPNIFGNQAPDSGNSELIAIGGSRRSSGSSRCCAARSRRRSHSPSRTSPAAIPR